jgi:hypothetical protein
MKTISKVTIVILTFILFLVSCSKPATNTLNNTIPSSNTWIFKGVINTLTTDTIAGDDMVASSISNNTLTFYFNNIPTTSGIYNVVSGTNLISTNQISISIRNNSGMVTYISAGTDNVKANITVTGGKITVSVPNVILLSPSNSSDTGILSANTTQTN